MSSEGTNAGKVSNDRDNDDEARVREEKGANDAEETEADNIVCFDYDDRRDEEGEAQNLFGSKQEPHKKRRKPD